jgi:hypothetical protein
MRHSRSMTSCSTFIAGEAGVQSQPVDSSDDRSPVIDGAHTANRLGSALVDAAVVGGAERWERRLRGPDAELNLQLGRARRE